MTREYRKNTLSIGLGCHTSLGYPGAGTEPKHNLAITVIVDLASVIDATYLLSAVEQRRRRTSGRLLPDRSNFAALALVIVGFSDESVFPNFSHAEAWTDYCRTEERCRPE